MEERRSRHSSVFFIAGTERLAPSVGKPDSLMAIGQRVPMLDAPLRVTGRLAYALDASLPGVLVGRVVRSPHPHARIVRIDTRRALAVPGVATVVTRDDVLARPAIDPYFGPQLADTPILALERVRYAGEPVALVAAVDDETADEAAELVDVEYEPLPALLDPDAALAPDAPFIHERGNLVNEMEIRHGDVERALETADVVVTEEYRTPPIQHVPLETHVVLAYEEGGKLTLISNTQSPHVTRGQVAHIFGLPLSHVRVIVPNLGGGFGGKAYVRFEPMTALAAMKTGRPVKLVLSRGEEFLTTHRQPTIVRLTSGTSHDGVIQALKAECIFTSGAYAETSPRVVRHGLYSASGAYRVPNVWVRSRAVYTNTVPGGPLRAPGSGQVHWARECHVDSVAARLGMDPVELRLRNLVQDGDRFVLGGLLEEMHLAEMLRETRRTMETPATRPTELAPTERIGRGYAVALKTTNTPSTSTASATLHEDGSLTVRTSSVEMGQGAHTAIAQIAAEEASLPLAHVAVAQVDTESTPFDHVTGSSRTTYAMGQAVSLAVREIKEQLLALAADQLEASVADLVADNGRVRVRGVPGQELEYGAIVRSARAGNLQGNGHFVVTARPDPVTGEPGASAHYHHAVGAAEVAVATDTGKVRLLRFHAAAFAGRMVNPTQCELQVQGNVVAGLGQALFEEVVYDGGKVVNPNLGDYLVPSMEDLPGHLSVSVGEDLARGEIHGVGETAAPAVPPAIANAVANAVGARVRDLPLTPEKVLRAIRAGETAL